VCHSNQSKIKDKCLSCFTTQDHNIAQRIGIGREICCWSPKACRGRGSRGGREVAVAAEDSEVEGELGLQILGVHGGVLGVLGSAADLVWLQQRSRGKKVEKLGVGLWRRKVPMDWWMGWSGCGCEMIWWE
jgi:hypothetical protein